MSEQRRPRPPSWEFSPHTADVQRRAETLWDFGRGEDVRRDLAYAARCVRMLQATDNPEARAAYAIEAAGVLLLYLATGGPEKTP